MNTRRFVMYMDPKICPTCGGEATEIVGARRYCLADAKSMRRFLGIEAPAPELERAS